jgi:hypothetical protein
VVVPVSKLSNQGLPRFKKNLALLAYAFWGFVSTVLLSFETFCCTPQSPKQLRHILKMYKVAKMEALKWVYSALRRENPASFDLFGTIWHQLSSAKVNLDTTIESFSCSLRLDTASWLSLPRIVINLLDRSNFRRGPSSLSLGNYQTQTNIHELICPTGKNWSKS